jgi:hypothetical protein
MSHEKQKSPEEPRFAQDSSAEAAVTGEAVCRCRSLILGKYTGKGREFAKPITTDEDYVCGHFGEYGRSPSPINRE